MPCRRQDRTVQRGCQNGVTPSTSILKLGSKASVQLMETGKYKISLDTEYAGVKHIGHK